MIDRFVNKDKIKESNSLIEGVSFNYESFMSLDISKAIIDELKSPCSLDIHVYDSKFELNKSIYGFKNDFDSSFDDINLDVCKLFFDSDIYEGTYKICFNFLYNIFGNINNQYFYIQEISPDELELKLAIRPKYLIENPEIIDKLKSFRDRVAFLRTVGYLNNIVINLGENKIYTIVNIKVDCDNEYVIYIKLLNTPVGINTGMMCHICFKAAEDYFDSFTVSSPEIVSQPRVLTANYLLSDTTGESTNYSTWNSLLDADIETSNNIINKVISSSASVPLNIDYSNFSNFIFYGSAQERIKNYNYKLQLIEFYTSQSNSIANSNASSSAYPSLDYDKIIKRSHKLKNSFDDFENYLYYSTGSLFSYDITGSLIPTPKYIDNGKYVNYHITSATYNYWYSSSLSKAYNFDIRNYNSLYEATPGHIVNDPDNSEYLVFLNMIGQHFDNLYAFVKELTSIHRRDEHPKRGIPNELLKTYAKSLGWEVNNGYQLSDLWLYKIGSDSTGSFSNTGLLASQAHENLTHQIWRRVVNNIPYLLKTKGTERSIKSLLSIYGIPQTLISIKEYGGAAPPKYSPAHKSYRYQYLLKFDGNQFVKIPWGKRIPPNESESSAPRVSEFRFKSDTSSSLSMSLWSIVDSKNSNKVYNNLELVSYRSISTSSFSGSYSYGYLRYKGASSTTYSTSSLSVNTVKSNYFPFFDGDVWNVRIFTDTNINNTNKTGSINIEWKKSSGQFENWISFSGSMSLNSNKDIAFTWGSTSSLSSPHNVILGGATGSQYAYSTSSRFTGFLQSYKDYSDFYSSKVFEEHTLNPAAYHGDSYSSSFDTLNRYYPLGVDSLRYNHSTYRFVSSSHPNRINSLYTTASFIGFSGSQENQYKPYTEIYYSYSPVIGANIPKSDKIRIEETIRVNNLSAEKRVQINTFDTTPVDSNKLAIVFSPTDQVNKDISNQYGNVNLDNLIGDPNDLYKDTYSSLRTNRENYWKKYKNRNNYNKYIEIFSLYDYSFFQQVTQLVPARANLIAGVLLEENLLERTRIARKNPSLSNPQYEKTIIKTDSQTGEYILYTGSIDYLMPVEMSVEKYSASLYNPPVLNFEYIKYTASLQNPINTEISYQKLSGSVKNPYYYNFIESSLDNQSLNSDNYMQELGSEIGIYNYIGLLDVENMNSEFQSLYKVDTTGKINESIATIINTNTLLGEFYFLSSSYDEVIAYKVKRNGVNKDKILRTKKINYYDGNISVISSNVSYESNINTVENIVGKVSNFNIDDFYNANISYNYVISSSYNNFNSTFTKKQLQEYLYRNDYFVNNQGNIYRKNYYVTQSYIESEKINSKYKKVVYHYSSSVSSNFDSSYKKDLSTAVSMSLKKYYSSSLQSVNYQYIEDSVSNRLRYTGCKLTGLDFNVDTTETIDGGPVVEFREVSANQIVV
jgi:hypothetical protein